MCSERIHCRMRSWNSSWAEKDKSTAGIVLLFQLQLKKAYPEIGYGTAEVVQVIKNAHDAIPADSTMAKLPPRR